ncbi:MAG: 3-keto-5-aminohexanoate cleavage protein [Firmicutes bacterium]|nr:3-keto-5-aminohexanoate cleavage protein [Bacillota bacterium]
MDKRIISVALTGNWGDKSKNPALPMTPEEIAASAYDAYNAGASIAHIHMRDEEGKPTMRVDLFEKTIALIREKCDIIINMTSSGGHSLDGMAADETRMKPFEVLKPEMGSYDCGTMNWLHKTVFENNPQFLENLGHLYQRVGTKPEIEIFDVGMLDTAKYYVKKGVLQAPCHFQFIMGAPGGMAGTIANLTYIHSQLPEGSTWSATGLSKAHVPVMLAALALGGHVRVGLEDNLYYSHGVLADSNAQLVERAARIITAAGLDVASVSDAREILGLRKEN